MQNILFSVKFKGVSGIGAALETRHHIIVGSQVIHNFSFSFIAPLKAQDNVYLVHKIEFSDKSRQKPKVSGNKFLS
jgi:hypothetical protein